MSNFNRVTSLDFFGAKSTILQSHGITGSIIEEFNFSPALDHISVNFRNKKDYRYIQQNTLYGLHTYKAPANITATDKFMPNDSTVTVKDQLVAGTESSALVSLSDPYYIKMLDNDKDTAKAAFSSIVLHRFSCVGIFYGISIDRAIAHYIETQTFWKQYRLLKSSINSDLSYEFILANKKFINVKDTFGTGSKINPLLSLPDTATVKLISIDGKEFTALLSEQGELSFSYLTLPDSTDILHSEVSVKFDYTVIEVASI